MEAGGSECCLWSHCSLPVGAPHPYPFTRDPLQSHSSGRWHPLPRDQMHLLCTVAIYAGFFLHLSSYHGCSSYVYIWHPAESLPVLSRAEVMPMTRVRPSAERDSLGGPKGCGWRRKCPAVAFQAPGIPRGLWQGCPKPALHHSM